MKLSLKRSYQLDARAHAFEFAIPEGFTWRAGQFIKVELDHVADAGGKARRFTIASAPHEGVVRIATRISRSSFKQALARLEPGDTLTVIDQPAGDFTWTPEVKVFVAQGIGITPFYAMLTDAQHTGTPANTTLLFTNLPGNGEPFLPQLKEMAEADPTLMIKTFPEPLSAADVATHADIASSTVYVSGPKSLLGLYLPPYNLSSKRLKQDNFSGYSQAGY